MWMKVNEMLNRWLIPALCVLVGVASAAMTLSFGGGWGAATGGLAAMVCYAVILVTTSGRSEIMALLRGTGTDERQRQIQWRASKLSLTVMAWTALVGFLVQLFRGEDVQPWATIMIVQGFSYTAGLLFFSRRS